MPCTSGCKTQDHRSFGECLRSKNVATCGLESTNPSFATDRVKKFDKDNDLYGSAIAQGIQPATTKVEDIHFALDASDKFGKPYRADA